MDGKEPLHPISAFGILLLSACLKKAPPHEENCVNAAKLMSKDCSSLGQYLGLGPGDTKHCMYWDCPCEAGDQMCGSGCRMFGILCLELPSNLVGRMDRIRKHFNSKYSVQQQHSIQGYILVSLSSDLVPEPR